MSSLRPAGFPHALLHLPKRNKFRIALGRGISTSFATMALDPVPPHANRRTMCLDDQLRHGDAGHPVAQQLVVGSTSGLPPRAHWAWASRIGSAASRGNDRTRPDWVKAPASKHTFGSLRLLSDS